MKLTKAQLQILKQMADDNCDLINDDEGAPQWYLEGGLGQNNNASRALARTDAVEYYKRLGGFPGVEFFRITPAGRAALAQGGEKNG